MESIYSGVWVGYMGRTLYHANYNILKQTRHFLSLTIKHPSQFFFKALQNGAASPEVAHQLRANVRVLSWTCSRIEHSVNVYVFTVNPFMAVSHLNVSDNPSRTMWPVTLGNCSGMVRWMWQTAQVPTSQSNRASLRCTGISRVYGSILATRRTQRIRCQVPALLRPSLNGSEPSAIHGK